MPHKKYEYENYLNLIDEALLLARKIPRYFSKYSNRIYCNHQKFVIVILMQKLKLTTRGVISFLRSNSSLCLEFGLLRVPVHTTVVRFFPKIKNLIGLFLGIRQAVTVAVDATGFELESKSFYYRNINKQLFPGFIRKTKQYMKLSIAVDTDKQLILNYKIRKKFRHDTLDFKDLIKDLSVKRVVADKGYDSRSNRLFVIRKLKAIPNIPYRSISGLTKLSGRNKWIPFDEASYHQRSKVETVFSVIKRKYGSVLRCKSFATQKVELISKLIVYNLDRKLNYLLLIFEGCTRAKFSNVFILSLQTII